MTGRKIVAGVLIGAFIASLITISGGLCVSADGKSGRAPARKKVIITEIYFSPTPRYDVTGEYVELYVQTPTNINGWRLADTATLNNPNQARADILSAVDMFLLPHKTIVVVDTAPDEGITSSADVLVVTSQVAWQLRNDEDTIFVVDSAGNIVDKLTYVTALKDNRLPPTAIREGDVVRVGAYRNIALDFTAKVARPGLPEVWVADPEPTPGIILR